MNYGEEIAYWYLRLNGFFPISNFVIHRSSRVEHTSDCDLLALRTPYVFEEIGGQADDWDPHLSTVLDFSRKTIGIICEVKTGAYTESALFRPEYLRYSVGRLGLVPQEQLEDVANRLTRAAILDLGDRVLCKLFVANKECRQGAFVFTPLHAVEDFIDNRVKKYPKEKYADRMYFGSELFQHAIHRVHREQENRSEDVRGDTGS